MRKKWRNVNVFFTPARKHSQIDTSLSIMESLQNHHHLGTWLKTERMFLCRLYYLNTHILRLFFWGSCFRLSFTSLTQLATTVRFYNVPVSLFCKKKHESFPFMASLDSPWSSCPHPKGIGHRLLPAQNSLQGWARWESPHCTERHLNKKFQPCPSPSFFSGTT